MNNKIKSTTYYYNDKGETVSKEEATNVIITEQDKNGNFTEVFGKLDTSIREKNSIPILSDEEAEKLIESFKKDYEEIKSRR